ncbi:hypothetical protein NL676_021171 [Syzygium grande]|nr:hypothetical protein NL676_021171 [Syzygium grande]
MATEDIVVVVEGVGVDGRDVTASCFAPVTAGGSKPDAIFVEQYIEDEGGDCDVRVFLGKKWLILDRLQEPDSDVKPIVGPVAELFRVLHGPKRTSSLRLHTKGTSRVPPAHTPNIAHRFSHHHPQPSPKPLRRDP